MRGRQACGVVISNPALLGGFVGVSMLKCPSIPPPSVPKRPGRPVTNLKLMVSYPILRQNRDAQSCFHGVESKKIQPTAVFCIHVTKFLCLPQECDSCG